MAVVMEFNLLEDAELNINRRHIIPSSVNNFPITVHLPEQFFKRHIPELEWQAAIQFGTQTEGEGELLKNGQRSCILS